MIRLTWQAFVVALLLGSTGWAQVTQRIDQALGGGQANAMCWKPSISADGRYVAFVGQASNLVPGDTNGLQDIFVRDRLAGTTERVSIATGGTQADGDSSYPCISPDGRYVAFRSEATNLVAGDANSAADVFVHDRLSGVTERESVDSNGNEANGPSSRPTISSGGRFVAFASTATNLDSGGVGGSSDVYIHDRLTGSTLCASVTPSGSHGNGPSANPWLSADGRYLSFDSEARDLVPLDLNMSSDIFRRDNLTGQLSMVSVNSIGREGNWDSRFPAISADGRYVAFVSLATNLVPGDSNAHPDVFRHDCQSGETIRVSVSSNGMEADQESPPPMNISADGRFVVFSSWADNLVPGDSNGHSDVFVHDGLTGETSRVSVDSSGSQALGGESSTPSITADDRFVFFSSWAANLVQGDTNGTSDVFVRDQDASGFVTACEPGMSGVHACPCLNPPSIPGRGCDNSAATGGAGLFASGVAYLSTDSLVFTTSDERPTAFSIVMQGNALLPNGVVYGQGVRCVGGAMKRLFTKHAVAGSITAPDFGAGDPTVSAQSAAKGDVIQPGQSRWYLVYYRDPNVLGGCPASSTFNATQTGQVTWWP